MILDVPVLRSEIDKYILRRFYECGITVASVLDTKGIILISTDTNEPLDDYDDLAPKLGIDTHYEWDGASAKATLTVSLT